MFIRIVHGKALLAGFLFFVFIFILGIVSGTTDLASFADAFSQR